VKVPSSFPNVNVPNAAVASVSVKTALNVLLVTADRILRGVVVLSLVTVVAMLLLLLKDLV
jgi:hypothetical protein